MFSLCTLKNFKITSTPNNLDILTTLQMEISSANYPDIILNVTVLFRQHSTAIISFLDLIEKQTT